MKRFLKTIALFCAPAVLLLGGFFAVLARSGELTPMEEAERAALQGSLTRLGLAYRDDTRTFKQRVAGAKSEAAGGLDVLVLGTSRSMQLRGDFFETASFYNAGGGIVYGSQALGFLQRLPAGALPRHLVLVLDQYFYNEQWASAEQADSAALRPYAQPDPVFALRHMLWDYADGKFSLRQVLSAPQGVYGLAAAGRGAGFGPDGAYSYGSAVLYPEQSADAGFRDTYERIRKKTNRFEQADTPCAESIAQTQALLAFCAENGVAVTAFLPPYAPGVWQRMQETGGYGYIPAAAQALRPLFEQYGFELFDYSLLPETDDSQYIDGFHGSDRVYAAVCARLAEDSALLNGLLDGGALTALFHAPGNPLTVG